MVVEPDDGLDPLVEAVEAEVFVGRVDGVGVEPEAHEHTVQAQVVLEVRHHRDRAAVAHEHRVGAAHLAHGVLGGLHRRGGGVDEHRLAAVQPPHGEGHRVGHLRLQVGLQLVVDVPQLLVGHEAHRNLRVGLRRKHRLGALAGVAAPDAVHVERGAGREAFERRVVALGPHVVDADGVPPGRLVERKGGVGLALGRRQVAHVLVKPGDGDAVVVVVQAGNEATERVGRVVHGAAVVAGVKVPVRALQGDLGVGQPAQAVRDRRRLRREHGRVRDEDDVAVEPLPLLADVRLDCHRAGFLFALDDVLEVDRKVALGRQVRLGGLGVHEHLALVVTRAAGVQGAVVPSWVERVGGPLLQRVGRLHVVVAVHDDGRLVGGGDVLGVDEGVAVGLDDLGVLHPDAVEVVGEPLGGPFHLVVVGGVGADRRDAQKLFELTDEPVGVAVGVGERSVHGRCELAMGEG